MMKSSKKASASAPVCQISHLTIGTPSTQRIDPNGILRRRQMVPAHRLRPRDAYRDRFERGLWKRLRAVHHLRLRFQRDGVDHDDKPLSVAIEELHEAKTRILSEDTDE